MIYFTKEFNLNYLFQCLLATSRFFSVTNMVSIFVKAGLFSGSSFQQSCIKLNISLVAFLGFSKRCPSLILSTTSALLSLPYGSLPHENTSVQVKCIQQTGSNSICILTPHQYSVRPHIRFGAETSVPQYFWRGPTNGKLGASTWSVLVVNHISAKVKWS